MDPSQRQSTALRTCGTPCSKTSICRHIGWVARDARPTVSVRSEGPYWRLTPEEGAERRGQPSPAVKGTQTFPSRAFKADAMTPKKIFSDPGYPSTRSCPGQRSAMVASRRGGPGRRVATGSGGLSWAWSSSGIEHEVAVAHGLVGDGELEDPIEDQSAAARA